MPDTTIVNLTASGAIADGDLLPIVDISDTAQSAGGSTRKITKANLVTDLAPKASPTFTGTVTTPDIILSNLTASELVSTDGSKQLQSLAVATYPSLTELAYVKGVTSAIQTQLDTKGTGNGDLLADGTVPLTADWDVGAYTIQGTQFISDIATGTAPFVVSSTTTVANLQAATVATITGLAPDTATTAAAQPNITSLGTLTALTVDDITLNGNTISSGGASTLAINPTAGQAITFDGTITLDAGVIAGATSITSTAFSGALTGNASTATALETARTIGGTSFDGTGNITVASATGGFAISGGDTTIADTNGLVVGATAQQSINGQTFEAQILGTSLADSSLALANWSTSDGNQPNLVFAKSGNGTIGSYTIVNDNEDVGEIRFIADDGVDLTNIVASIEVDVDDATPAENAIGGQITLRTSTSAGSLTDALRIDAAQLVYISDTLLVNQATDSGARLQVSEATDAHINFDADTGNATPTEGDFWRESDGVKYYDGVIEHNITPTVLSIVPRPTSLYADGVATLRMNVNTTAHYGSFTLETAITVNKITINASAVGVAGTYDIGIYSENGQTQIATVTTASISGTGDVTTSFAGAFNLSPGNYYVVMVGNGTADVTFQIWDTMNRLDNLSGEPVHVGTSTVTAGTLPATFDPTTNITFAANHMIQFRFDN